MPHRQCKTCIFPLHAVTLMLNSAQCPRASTSSQREHLPVLSTQHDQHLSAAASDMISFGVSDDKMDDSLSVATKIKDKSTCPLFMSPWSVAAHLCPPTANGWKARASHPSKPRRATSALAGCAYSAAGQAASALHSMAVLLQVFQAKMLASEEAGLDLASLRYLRSATDLALCVTKSIDLAIGRSMSSLIVLERHLWLTMTEMKKADKVPFLDDPVSSGSLFGRAVEGFAEHFTEAQKSSQAM